MPAIEQDHIDDLRQHSISSWPRVFIAAGFAFVVTFTSTILVGSVPQWNAITGIGILFSVFATLYALLSVGLTTYFEAKARHDYDNSIFARSSLPLEVFIMKEALKVRPKTNRN